MKSNYSVFERMPIVETWEIVYQYVDEGGRRTIGFLDAVDEAASKFLPLLAKSRNLENLGPYFVKYIASFSNTIDPIF